VFSFQVLDFEFEIYPVTSSAPLRILCGANIFIPDHSPAFNHFHFSLLSATDAFSVIAAAAHGALIQRD
jgi:hypothetical protein